MNQKLQTILDIIQQSEKLDAEQKNNLLKAVQDADKELEITAFKLERTEKVKKTTAILLEETIEELEQKRKSVEAQNRELEIEASLERVRAIAMGMNKSDDLLSICEVSFNEFKKLGFNNLRNSLINIFNDEEETFVNYDYSDYLGGSISNDSYNSNTANEEFLIKIRKANDAFVVSVIDRNQLDEWKEFRRSHGEKDDPRLDNINALYYYNYSIGSGSIGISNFDPISEEQQIILKRFRNVFDLAYRRYTDIALAEAHAREAQIEAALEKVRAVAMSMNRPDDLLNICEVSFKEFQKLGFKNIRNALIHIPNDEQKYFMDYDFSELIGGAITKIGYGTHPIVDDYIKKIRSAADAYFEVVIDKDQLKGWLEFRRESGQKDDPRLDKAAAVYLYFFSIGIGDIGISTFEPIDESQINILKRFRNVFKLSYQRYTDITLAEAQTREAQIELALERVRAKAMAMHSSKDLADTIGAFYRELKSLGVIPRRCGVALIEKETRLAEVSTMNTTEEGDSVGVIGKIKMTGHPILENIFDNWLIQKEFHTVLRGNQINDYYKVLKPQISYPDYPNDVVQFGYYFMFTEGDVYAWTDKELMEEELKIFRRFTTVISLTYKRYIDLQQAEAQAKEAIKQASLDRIRGEIASMRTSEDLNSITPIIWRELKTLEVPFIRCGVFIVDEVQERTQVYLTTPDGKSLGVLNLQFGSNELSSNIVEQWRKGQVYSEHWDKEKFISWTKSMMELGQVQNPETYQGSSAPPESLNLHFIPFTQGMLYVGDVSPLNDEKLQLVKTLGEAFSIAYARYEDFKNLEEAKNKIELTLIELKSAQAQLVHSEKMASLGELTAGIAHEIKNPLNFVNNFSEMSSELLDEMKIELEKNNIKEVIEIVTDLKQNLEKINLHGKRADSIVKGMLLHSRGSSGEKTLTDINELLDQYVNLAYHGMRAQNKEFNITLEKDYDNSLEKINVVPQDISRVFLNIINNACYAAYERKKLSGDSFDPVLKVSTKNLKDKVEIRIGDNGNGIPADFIDKIFQPFFTTKPTGEGTGLGLSLSHDIVKAHGGDVKVKTNVGKGTVFTIDLPIGN